MMSTAEDPHFVSVDEYLASEEAAFSKSEYIDGWVRAMSGATIRHNRVKGNCHYHLMRMLVGQPCQPYDSDTKLRVNRTHRKRYYYPDVQVVCQTNPETLVYQDLPVLIIEVLSPSTRRYDLDEKLDAYLDIVSLDCYIILEQHTPIAIVMRRTDKGFLRQTYEGVETNIPLPFLGCSLSLRDIYDGVTFTPTCVQEPEPEYEMG
jgi:Uma2 family endonuclease